VVRLFIASPIRCQIPPKYSVSGDGFKCNTQLRSELLVISNFIAFQELTPSSLLHIRHPDPRKLSPATFAFCVDIHHESAHSIGISTSATPVIVMFIMASDSISLRSQALDVKIWIPTLEIPRSVLDTSDNVVTVYYSNF
jgi:hypothetical protein